ncbi:Camk protein kinase, partial [Globisporangium splendens]
MRGSTNGLLAHCCRRVQAECEHVEAHREGGNEGGEQQRHRVESDVEDDASSDGSAYVRQKTTAEKKKRQGANSSSGEDNNGGDRRNDAGGTTSSTDTPRTTKNTNRFTKNLQNKLKRMWNAGEMKRTPLLEITTIEAVYSAMHGKDKKRVRAELLEMFARYDKEETGRIGDTRLLYEKRERNKQLPKPTTKQKNLPCLNHLRQRRGRKSVLLRTTVSLSFKGAVSTSLFVNCLTCTLKTPEFIKGPHEKPSPNQIKSSRKSKRATTGKTKQRGSSSSAESDNSNSSQSSGLDMKQLRRIKKGFHTRGWDEGDQVVDGDTEEEYGYEDQVRSHSDREYDKHLKRSLRRVFDVFDLDQSDTIEKKELSHVLRALEHEFTTDELDAEMARADLDQNGRLDFQEFIAFVKRQLVQKQFLLSKQREMEIRQAFQSLDNDKNGVLDEKEFEYLIYKILGVELSVEEQDALSDFVDENGDGNINEDEFIAFMKVMEEFCKIQGSKAKWSRFLASLDGTSKLALSAMEKLVRGAPIDLDKNLLMFFGVPTNFRPAISSATTCRALQDNTLERALSFPSPQMIVALTQDPTQKVPDKKDRARFALTAKKDADASDEIFLLQQVESWQSHAVVLLKRAAGVPKPFDTREEDVLKRCVHVCLFQEQEEMHAKLAKNRRKKEHKQPAAGGGTVIGNVHEIPVFWHPGEEGVWEFSEKATKQDKYKFLVRTDTVNDHLHLLAEFIVHLHMAKREERRKGRRKHTASDRA